MRQRGPFGSRTAGDVTATAGAMEWEGEACDKLVLRPVAEVHGKGRRNGRVSGWYVAAYDLLVPAQATASLVMSQHFAEGLFSASVSSE